MDSIALTRALPDADFAHSAPFRIEAEVGAVIEDGRRVVLADATGRAMADWRDLEAPKPGDRIRAEGVTSVNRWGDRLLSVRTFSVVRSAPPPAPTPANLGDIDDPELNLRQVSVEGLVEDVFEDETDRRWIYIVLNSAGRRTYLTIPKSRISQDMAASLTDSRVSASGTCIQESFGHRPYLGTHVSIADGSDIRIVAPAGDPFAVRPLYELRGHRRESIAQSGRRRAAGVVKAVWSPSEFMLATTSGPPCVVSLAAGRRPPAPGASVEATGYPQTDFFSLRLVGGDWRNAAPPQAWRPEEPVMATAKTLFVDRHGNLSLKPACHGRTYLVRGRVRRIDGVGREFAEMTVEIDGADLAFNDGGTGAFDDLRPGSVVEAAGVCVLLAGTWDARTPFPHARGYVFVLRSRSDLRMVALPPWWTPGRFLAVICALLAGIAGVLVWNRALNHIIERRSRQLLKEQVAVVEAKLRVGERTRLSIELHDALSQNLAAVAFQVAAARGATSEGTPAAGALDTAARMLLSCRTELRRCLWDLRGGALEESSVSDAIRATITPACDEAEVDVRFAVPRKRLSDTTAHSILCIVRELATNAVRHGGARRIAVSGNVEGGRLVFSVQDDGTGFDPGKCGGPDTGHFGLDGVRRRVERLGGVFSIAAGLGGGMCATVSLPVHEREAANRAKESPS